MYSNKIACAQYCQPWLWETGAVFLFLKIKKAYYRKTKNYRFILLAKLDIPYWVM